MEWSPWFPGFVVVSGNVAVLEGEQASVSSSPGLLLGLASDLDWHQNAKRIHPAVPDPSALSPDPSVFSHF